MRILLTMPKAIIIFGVLVSTAIGLTGCSFAPANAGAGTPATPQEMSQAETEIQRIKSDTSLPPQAKEQRIKQIELWLKQKRGGK